MRNYKYLSVVLALLAFQVSPAFAARIGADTLIVGKQGSSANKTLKMGSGQVIWSQSDSKLKFSNDNGGTLKDIGSGSGGGQGVSIITDLNPDFEAGSPPSSWTASGGSFTAGTSSPNLLFGGKSGVFNSSATSQTLTNTAVTVTSSSGQGLNGGNGYASCFFKTTATDYKIQVWDGTNVLSERVIPALASAQEIGTYFIMPSSGTIALRIISQSDAADLIIDNCFLGSANVQQIAQNGFIGSAYIPTTGSCTWARTNTVLGAFTTTAACPGPTVEDNPTGQGVLQTTDTDLPQFPVNGLGTGTFKVTMNVPINMAAGQICNVAINDGTDTKGRANAGGGTAGLRAPSTVTAFFTYTSPGNKTFALFGACDAGSLTVDNVNGVNRLWFSIEKVASAVTEQSIKPDQIIQKWTGYHDNTCAWARTNAAYGDPAADATCNLTQRLSTNLTVTSALSGSDKLPGVVINASMARKFNVCATPKMYTDASTQFLDARLTDGTTVVAEWQFRGATANQSSSMQRCGTYQAVVGANTLKIQLASSAGTASINPTGTALPLAAIEWEIWADDTPQAAPLLVGYPKIKSAEVTSTGVACSVTRQTDATWLSSPVRNGTGDCSFTMSGFSGVPYCTCTHLGTQFGGTCRVQTLTSSSIRLEADYAGGAGANPSQNDAQPNMVTCWEPLF